MSATTVGHATPTAQRTGSQLVVAEEHASDGLVSLPGHNDTAVHSHDLGGEESAQDSDDPGGEDSAHLAKLGSMLFLPGLREWASSSMSFSAGQIFRAWFLHVRCFGGIQQRLGADVHAALGQYVMPNLGCPKDVEEAAGGGLRMLAGRITRIIRSDGSVERENADQEAAWEETSNSDDAWMQMHKDMFPGREVIFVEWAIDGCERGGYALPNRWGLAMAGKLGNEQQASFPLCLASQEAVEEAKKEVAARLARKGLADVASKEMMGRSDKHELSSPQKKEGVMGSRRKGKRPLLLQKGGLMGMTASSVLKHNAVGILDAIQCPIAEGTGAVQISPADDVEKDSKQTAYPFPADESWSRAVSPLPREAWTQQSLRTPVHHSSLSSQMSMLQSGGCSASATSTFEAETLSGPERPRQGFVQQDALFGTNDFFSQTDDTSKTEKITIHHFFKPKFVKSRFLGKIISAATSTRQSNVKNDSDAQSTTVPRNLMFVAARVKQESIAARKRVQILSSGGEHVTTATGGKSNRRVPFQCRIAAETELRFLPKIVAANPGRPKSILIVKPMNKKMSLHQVCNFSTEMRRLQTSTLVVSDMTDFMDVKNLLHTVKLTLGSRQTNQVRVQVLSTICLSRVYLGDESISFFIQGLLDSADCQLEHLCLKKNNLGDQGAAKIAECLCMKIDIVSGLKWRSMGEKNPDAKGIELKPRKHFKLTKALENKTEFTEEEFNTFGLDQVLCTNHFIKIETESWTSFFQPVVTSRQRYGVACTLRTLLLEQNEIGDKGASVLSAAIADHPRLEFLNLSNNVITDKGAQDVSVNLKKNHTLRHLSLDANRIVGAGNESFDRTVRHDTAGGRQFTILSGTQAQLRIVRSKSPKSVSSSRMVFHGADTEAQEFDRFTLDKRNKRTNHTIDKVNMLSDREKAVEESFLLDSRKTKGREQKYQKNIKMALQELAQKEEDNLAAVAVVADIAKTLGKLRKLLATVVKERNAGWKGTAKRIEEEIDFYVREQGRKTAQIEESGDHARQDSCHLLYQKSLVITAEDMIKDRFAPTAEFLDQLHRIYGPQQVDVEEGHDDFPPHGTMQAFLFDPSQVHSGLLVSPLDTEQMSEGRQVNESDERNSLASESQPEASGLQWERTGAEHPPVNGRLLENNDLSQALGRTTHFTQEQWDEFCIDDLRLDHYIQGFDSKNGESCFFRPCFISGPIVATHTTITYRQGYSDWNAALLDPVLPFGSPSYIEFTILEQPATVKRCNMLFGLSQEPLDVQTAPFLLESGIMLFPRRGRVFTNGKAIHSQAREVSLEKDDTLAMLVDAAQTRLTFYHTHLGVRSEVCHVALDELHGWNQTPSSPRKFYWAVTLGISGQQLEASSGRIARERVIAQNRKRMEAAAAATAASVSIDLDAENACLADKGDRTEYGDDAFE